MQGSTKFTEKGKKIEPSAVYWELFEHFSENNCIYFYDVIRFRVFHVLKPPQSY